MTLTNNKQILARSFGTIAAVIILATGVTYAALISQQAKISGNTIATATANLKISGDGVSYSSSQQGFLYSGLVPGGPPAPYEGRSIWLKNYGDTPLVLKLAVSSIPTNPDNVDMSKINVILTPVGFNAGPAQTFTLQSLVDASSTGGITITSPVNLSVNNVQQFTLKISMAVDAVSNQSATLGNIDFAFTGQAIAN